MPFRPTSLTFSCGRSIRLAAQRCSRAIAEAYARGYLGQQHTGYLFQPGIISSQQRRALHLRGGNRLLNALEGRRANPRAKPPFPPVVGLWGKPTIVNNVETISNVPHIIEHGADWFRQLSRSVDGGTKIYGVSGRVRKPGTWELPMGTTIREVLEEHAGGMRDGFKLRALIPGGASTEFMLADQLDVKMDFDSMQAAGSRLGTGTMIILDDLTCPVGMVLNLMRFFAQESCGWCTPCREGLPWLGRILEAIENGRGELKDMEVLERHTGLLGPGHTFCALAPGAMEPLQSALKFFEDDFLRHIREKRCPWR